MNDWTFDPEHETLHIIQWIKDWFAENGPDADAIIGISGGKDSTVCAALLAEALGPERVIGVMMPNVTQPDIQDAQKAIDVTGIRNMTVNIGPIVSSAYAAVIDACSQAMDVFDVYLTENAMINVPPRIRMTILYAIAQGLPFGGRVCNTCNLSEDYVGYSTKYGDAAGDFSPLANYTVSEVLKIGKALELPDDLVFKTPSDGLCGKTDEDRFGFTYETLDRYIRTRTCDDTHVKEKINRMHERNMHKLKPMPACPRTG